MDARFCKPLDEGMLRQLAASHPVMVTVEEGAIGGFAAHVLTFLTNEGLLDGDSLKFRSMTLPDRCVLLGAPRLVCLSATRVCAQVVNWAMSAAVQK